MSVYLEQTLKAGAGSERALVCHVLVFGSRTMHIVRVRLLLTRVIGLRPACGYFFKLLQVCAVLFGGKIWVLFGQCQAEVTDKEDVIV